MIFKGLIAGAQKYIITILITLLGAALLASVYLMDRNDTLASQNGELKVALTTEQARTEKRKEDEKREAILRSSLNKIIQEADKGKDELIRLFRTHDFNKLIKEKPGLIENRINKGTDDLFKEFEDVTNNSNLNS